MVGYHLHCLISYDLLFVKRIISHGVINSGTLFVNSISVMWIISRVTSSRDGAPRNWQGFSAKVSGMGQAKMY